MSRLDHRRLRDDEGNVVGGDWSSSGISVCIRARTDGTVVAPKGTSLRVPLSEHRDIHD